MADVEKAEPEYVPADYVAPADADEQAKGGRWSQCCDWPLAFREALEVILWLIARSTSHWSFNRYFVFITRVLVLILLWYDLRQFKAIAAMYPLDDKWPGFLEMLGRSLAGLLLVALFFLALIDSGSRLVVLKAVLG